MRMYSPVPVVSREVVSPLSIDGVDIPKGVMVDINFYQLHTNIHVWDKAMVCGMCSVTHSWWTVRYVSCCLFVTFNFLSPRRKIRRDAPDNR